MNQYDLNLILNPNISAEQVQIEKDYIEGAVRSAGGEVSNLDEPENRFETESKLLEVYQRVETTTGRPLLFEAAGSFDVPPRELVR